MNDFAQSSRNSFPIRVMAAIIALALAVLCLTYPKEIGARVDAVVLGLMVAAFLILILPWERLRTFKAAGVELAVDLPVVQSAIAGMGLDRVDDRRLKDQLRDLAPFIEKISRARILWIDDRPQKILGVRRLFRSLGVEVVPANSSDVALRMLLADNDFDLIISDVQRLGCAHRFTGGVEIHDGINFILLLHRSGDRRLEPIPRVLFFAGYDWPDVIRHTAPVRALSPDIDICGRRVDILITKAILALAEARSSPIVVRPEKEGTALERPLESIMVSDWAVEQNFDVYPFDEEEDEEEEMGGEEEEHEDDQY